MSYEIVAYRPGHPQLRIVLDGYEVFGMTLGPIEDSHHQWFAEILERGIKDAIEGAVRRARAEDQAVFRRLAGIGDPR